MSRCQLFPWLRANHRHHTHYRHGIGYGRPYQMGWDVLYLSPFAHRLLHFPWGRVRNQNRFARWVAAMFPAFAQPVVLALLRYPHPGQRLAHTIARINWLLKR